MPVSPNILIVEDGSIVADANSYIDYDYAENYHTLRGNSAWADGDSTQKQYAIIPSNSGGRLDLQGQMERQSYRIRHARA